jgi:hypothetical protein
MTSQSFCWKCQIFGEEVSNYVINNIIVKIKNNSKFV